MSTVDWSEQLQTVMKMRQWSQGALAERLGVSFMSVNSWLNKRSQPKSTRLREIEAVYAELAIASMSSISQTTLSEGPAVETSPVLTKQQMDALLRGQGDATIINVLRHSQHALFLHRLATAVARTPIAFVADAILLLDLAKQHDAASCADLLMHSHIALWAATWEQATIDDASKDRLSDHVDHFAAVAAAVAWKCGVENFTIHIPIRNGQAVLPGLGRALLPELEDAAKATVRCVAGQLTVSAAKHTVSLPDDLSCSTLQWEPIRTMSMESNGLTLKLAIDDVDPYRLEGEAIPSSFSSRRLDEIDYKEWKERLADAWAVLVRDHKQRAIEMTHAFSVLVPIESDIIDANASHYNGFGAVLSTIGSSPTSIVASFTEELQHAKFRALHAMTPLHAALESSDHLAPYCDHARPFSNLLDTFYSSPFVAKVWKKHLRSALSSDHFEASVNLELRRQWIDSLYSTLCDSTELTPLGKKMVVTLYEETAKNAEIVDSSVVELARNIAIDRRLCIRLTNLTCHDDDIQRLARAWMTGMACPTTSSLHIVLRPSTPVFGWKRRRRLGELLCTHAQTLDDLQQSEVFLDLVVPTATLPDVYAVSEQYELALAGYLKSIEIDGDNAEAWAGLAFVLTRSGATNGMSTLGRFPEVVLSLHRYLRTEYGRDEPVMLLTQWLEPLLLRMDDGTYERSSTRNEND